MASYGQLVGQPAYDDSGLFERHAGTPDNSEAASSSAPALKITVADPLKKVRRRKYACRPSSLQVHLSRRWRVI